MYIYIYIHNDFGRALSADIQQMYETHILNAVPWEQKGLR